MSGASNHLQTTSSLNRHRPMLDYAVFASHGFNPNDYAHAVLAGEPYPSQSASKPKTKLSTVEPAKEDISVAITKLNSGIDDVSKQLKNVVSLFRP